MTPHVHIGAVEFVTVACYTLIFSLAWRVAAAKLADKHPDLAGGMAAVYS